MAERVSTGGTKSFVYGEGDISKLDDSRKKAIQEGYEKYYERKERERKKRNLYIGIIVAIIILVLAFLFLKFF